MVDDDDDDDKENEACRVLILDMSRTEDQEPQQEGLGLCMEILRFGL